MQKSEIKVIVYFALFHDVLLVDEKIVDKFDLWGQFIGLVDKIEESGRGGQLEDYLVEKNQKLWYLRSCVV